MPLEVVVELQIRVISCPGVYLPDKQDVYLGVYLLNQYLETDCFPSVFPITIQQSMRFEKVFENAIDPGAVAEILESFLTRFELIQLVPPVWEELACYEENTRDFLFPEPKLTPSLPGMCREVLMKTFAGFPCRDSRNLVLLNPLIGLAITALILLLRELDKTEPGIAPKIEFSTRTAIRECVFLPRNRFLEDRDKSRQPLSTSEGPIFPLKSMRMKPKDSNLTRGPQGAHSGAPSPRPLRRLLQDQPAPQSLGNNFRISRESKPPFVVRHVDSTKPFGENTSELLSWKSRRRPKFSNFPFPGRRASSLDSLATNVKVIKEPDERIILRKESPSALDSRKFGKASPSYSYQGDADFRPEASSATCQHSRSSSPLLDRPLLRERSHLSSQSTWRKIHERVCSLLTSHRAQQHPNKKYPISETKYTLERPSYPLKKYPVHEQRYF